MIRLYVDSSTDARIQEVLRSDKFETCTILTIAHRIQTISDCHKIIVMSNGELAAEGSYSQISDVSDGL